MQRAGSCPRRPPRSTLAHLHLQFLSFHTLTVSGFLMQSARFVFRLPAFADPGGIKSIRSRLAHRSELLLETVCSSYLPKLNSQPQRARRDRENLFSRRVQCLEWPHRREPRHGQVWTAFLSSSSRLPPSSLERLVMPVTLTPGRARLSTSPASTDRLEQHRKSVSCQLYLLTSWVASGVLGLLSNILISEGKLLHVQIFR